MHAFAMGGDIVMMEGRRLACPLQRLEVSVCVITSVVR